jgi:hypothetical protein
MTNQGSYTEDSAPSTSGSHRFGYYAAILTALLTIVTFGFAITAIPVSGANCTGDCFDYPYLDTVSQFPKDFYWMPLAMMMVLAYVTLAVSIHAYASRQKRVFSQAGLAFALVAATVLLADYFSQFSVIPVSLMNGETEGLAAFIQYNPHGVFIALEELGYIVMSLSFLFMAPVFSGKTGLESAVRWVFIIGFVLAFAALAVMSIVFGLERQDRFEVAVISIDWLVLVINGVLLGIVFRRQMKGNTSHNR